MSCCCAAPPPSVVKVAPKRQGEDRQWIVLALLVLLSGAAMQVNLAVNLDLPQGRVRWLLHGGLAAAGFLAVALSWRELFGNAWRAVRERRVVTEHLFLAGIVAAWVVSVVATVRGSGAVFYEVPILLPAIRYFGAVLLRRQRQAIEAATLEQLAGIATARVWRGGGWRMLTLGEVELGERLKVEPGELIPADGVVRAGSAYLQCQSLTGEPFPVPVQPGEVVQAGTRALDGALEVTVSGEAQRSELARMTEVTRRLLDATPPYLRSVERVVGWFLPVIALVAGASGVFWWWRSGWPEAVANALAVVLVACPCAFGVAIPLLYRRGTVALLRAGLEPVDGSLIEHLSEVRTVAFDKTGTLTTLEMEAVEEELAPGWEKGKARAIVAALHARSDHPVARVFWRWAALGAGLAVERLRVVPGRGVEARVDGRTVRLGHERFFEGESPPWASGRAGRVLWLEVEGERVACFRLSEGVHEEASSMAAALRARGYRLRLLTGDASVPERMANWFDQVESGLRPEEKLARIKEEPGVLFIGDGVNDAAALAAATASFAVGESAPLAAVSAQALWREPRFGLLPSLLEKARVMAARRGTILRVALTYNALGMAIAAAGGLHPVTATIVMLLSSATVTALATK